MSKHKKKRLQRKEKFLKRKHFEKFLKKKLNKDSFNFKNTVIQMDEFDKILGAMGDNNNNKGKTGVNKKRTQNQGIIMLRPHCAYSVLTQCCSGVINHMIR